MAKNYKEVYMRNTFRSYILLILLISVLGTSLVYTAPLQQPSISTRLNILKTGSTPSTPTTGYGTVWVKTDKTVHYLDADASDVTLGSTFSLPFTGSQSYVTGNSNSYLFAVTNSHTTTVNDNTEGAIRGTSAGTAISLLGTNTGTGAGVLGYNTSTGKAIWGYELDTEGGYAGYFDGHVLVSKNLTIQKHILSGGSTPSIALGSSGQVGSTSTASSISGNDIAGSFSITAGTTGVITTGNFATITFASAYASAPKIIITATNSNGAVAATYVSSNTTSFTIADTVPLVNTSTYTYNYYVVQ